MTKKPMKWTADLTRATGKSYNTENFTSSSGNDELLIEATPWGEGDLSINGESVAHVENDTSTYEVFRDLEQIAEDLENTDTENSIENNSQKKA